MSKPVARSVESLKTLLNQINEYAPNRSKASDGWIGDAAHAGRKSDHNPDADGTVDARDFTHDPAGGVDIAQLFIALNRSRDRRISYVIANGQIFSGRTGVQPWVIRKYTGSNAHTKHLHISVLDEGQDDTTPWNIAAAFTGNTPPALTAKQTTAVLKLGSKGDFVRDLQLNLNRLGYGPLVVDGVFGKGTEQAVRAFQNKHDLLTDGWVGPRTSAAIGRALASSELLPKLHKAEDKAGAAKSVVTNTANDGKVTLTEWLAGLTGVSTAVSVASEVANGVSSTTQSVTNVLATLGPWVLLGVVTVAVTAYIVWDRRKRRIEAKQVAEEL